MSDYIIVYWPGLSRPFEFEWAIPVMGIVLTELEVEAPLPKEEEAPFSGK